MNKSGTTTLTSFDTLVQPISQASSFKNPRYSSSMRCLSLILLYNWAATFKIFQNLGNLWSKPTSSRDIKTKTKNTRQHCCLNICSYIGWIDKLSIQPIVTNIETAVLSKKHFLSAMSQFTFDKYHRFCCCAYAVGWWGGLGQSREGWHWEDEAALINQGPGSYHKSRQHRLNDLSCIKSEKFRALAFDILW